jgi:hypothetical protein
MLYLLRAEWKGAKSENREEHFRCKIREVMQISTRFGDDDLKNLIRQSANLSETSNP